MQGFVKGETNQLNTSDDKISLQLQSKNITAMVPYFLNFINTHSRLLFQFFLFCTVKMLMSGFERRSSGAGSNCSVICATPSGQSYKSSTIVIYNYSHYDLKISVLMTRNVKLRSLNPLRIGLATGCGTNDRTVASKPRRHRFKSRL